ncbi:MAG TPA: YaaC family protein [Chitinophagaceae bacterium]
MNDKVWDKILEYQTRDLVERFIKTKFNRDASARHILEITSNFIQGREYFLNAQRAAISVKPLLLYYGVSALTRGLILAISPHLSEAAMKSSHGLDAVNWKEALSSKKFGDLTISIRNGTFLELLNVTSNRTYFKHNSSGVSWNINFDIPKTDAKIRFDDLVQTVSDLSDEYETWTQNKVSFFRLDTFKPISASNEFEYVVHKDRNEENEIFNIFPKAIFGEYHREEANKKFVIRTSNKNIPQFSQRFLDAFNMGIGEIVLTKAISSETHLNTLGQLYCLSFYLGMLSRYFPSIWISLGRTEKGDAIYPLFIRIIDLVEKHFPRTVIEFLAGPYDFEKKNSD